jgi:HEPN domain-containing protein
MLAREACRACRYAAAVRYRESPLAPSDDLRQLASARLREAKALLDAGEWSGAYYLAGYAVECGLKVCISKSFSKYTFPDPKIGRGMYTHGLYELVRFAGLESQLKTDMAADTTFAVQWAVAKDWNESSRYTLWPEADARDLYRAINMRAHGVLRWVKKQW